MAVRTKCLDARSVASNTEVEVYQCPSGETAILKDVRASNSSGSSARALLYVLSGPAQVLIWDQTISDGTCAGVDRWVVLEPGNTLRAAALGGAIKFYLSGTELAGVAS